MDSSDDEDVKPVVIKTEAETSTDRQENNQKESPILPNQKNAPGGESSITKR